MAPTIFCVGNLAKQTASIRGSLQTFLSGSAAFTALAARIVGGNVYLLSSIGKDFPQNWISMLEAKGIKLKLKKLKNEDSISFESKFPRGLELEVLTGKNLKIHVRNLIPLLREALSKTRPTAVYISPNEFKIQRELIRMAKRVPSRPVVALGIHEFNLKKMREPGDVLTSLSDVDLFFLNEREALLVTKALSFHEAVKELKRRLSSGEDCVCIITMGKRGLSLIYKGGMMRIPVFPVAKEVDPTGAGDSLAGAFLTKYLESKSLLESAIYGRLIGGLTVTGIGSTPLFNLTKFKIETLIRGREGVSKPHFE
ncbi:TPA: hypothetical protein EYP26_03775 [Candidatus Bathyarchaeota archaeon]|nr:hypothetical protein [Candidatus Bathyarchaeota archaeon]